LQINLDLYSTPVPAYNFEQAEEDTFGYGKQDDLEGGPIAEEELLVVIKRGRDADIFGRARLPIGKTDDIRTWAGSMSWKDIKNGWLHIKDANSTDSDFEGDYDPPSDGGVHIDGYRDVDNVGWWLNEFWREIRCHGWDGIMRDYDGDRRNVP
jgi:hypothetical protein